MLKNDIKHILRQKQTGFFCKHKKAALSTIKLFHVFLMHCPSHFILVVYSITHIAESDSKGIPDPPP